MRNRPLTVLFAITLLTAFFFAGCKDDNADKKPVVDQPHQNFTQPTAEKKPLVDPDTEKAIQTLGIRLDEAEKKLGQTELNLDITQKNLEETRKNLDQTRRNLDQNEKNMEKTKQELEQRATKIEEETIGTIATFAFDKNIPDGYILCDGRTFDLSDQAMAKLFEKIGCTWGCKDSSFRIPDLRAMFLRGSGQSPLKMANGESYDAGTTGKVSYDGFQPFKMGSDNGAGEMFRAHTYAIPGGATMDALAGFASNANAGSIIPNIPFGNFGQPRWSTETKPVSASVAFYIKYK